MKPDRAICEQLAQFGRTTIWLKSEKDNALLHLATALAPWTAAQWKRRLVEIEARVLQLRREFDAFHRSIKRG